VPKKAAKGPAAEEPERSSSSLLGKFLRSSSGSLLKLKRSTSASSMSEVEEQEARRAAYFAQLQEGEARGGRPSGRCRSCCCCSCCRTL
jgi:hypothetical protein